MTNERSKKINYQVVFDHPKTTRNVGSIMRTADIMGVDKVTITRGDRIDQLYHSTDTAKSYRRIGYTADTLADVARNNPEKRIVIVECAKDAPSGTPVTFLPYFFPQDGDILVLGSEDHGFDFRQLDSIENTVVVLDIPTDKTWSLNVAEAYSMVAWKIAELNFRPH